MKSISTKPARRSMRVVVGALVLAVLVLVAASVWYIFKAHHMPYLLRHTSNVESQAFPDVDMSNLSPLRQRIILAIEQEHTAQPSGQKYSQGIAEPWCADFVSWIMREAGAPLANPHSGGWRIPGTITLREYYQAAGAFKKGSSDYQPQPGDVVLYDIPNPSGQHTNFVVKNDSGIITTVGGNENGRIGVRKHTVGEVGLVGYGVSGK